MLNKLGIDKALETGKLNYNILQIKFIINMMKANETNHLLVESSNESSHFPETLDVVIFPAFPPLDLIGGTKLPRKPRRDKPPDLMP